MGSCPNCNSRGRIEGPPGAIRLNAYIKTCPTCKGTGKVGDNARWWEECPECLGWGETGTRANPRICPVCRGVGMVDKSVRRPKAP